MNPKTTFIGKTNPFTGAPMRPVDHVDPDSLAITNDPLPAGRAKTNKYSAVLDKLKPGQCIKCKAEHVGAVASAVKKHIENNRLDCTVRLTKNYGDGLGRVWLMKNERKLKVA